MIDNWYLPAYLKKKDDKIPWAALLHIKSMVAFECPCRISKLLGPKSKEVKELNQLVNKWIMHVLRAIYTTSKCQNISKNIYKNLWDNQELAAKHDQWSAVDNHIIISTKHSELIRSFIPSTVNSELKVYVLPLKIAIPRMARKLNMAPYP